MSDSCGIPGAYKCSSCAFSNEESSTCANPNIWKKDPGDSYYKSRHEKLTEIEIKSIEEHLHVNYK